MVFCLCLYAALLTLEIQITAANSFDWCSLNCDGKEHTMCQVKEGEGKCKEKLSENDKSVILEAHNQLRLNVAIGNKTGQLTAGNMRVVVWDEEAARIAERWAGTCPRGVDDCRILQNGEDLGQNFGSELSTSDSAQKETIEKLIQMWFDQIKDMSPKTVDSFEQSTTGNKITYYTQLVWADTYRVGCGIGTVRIDKNHILFLICNYYPRGNHLNKQIYLKGEPCSKCPNGTACSRTWPGLCTHDKDDFGGTLISAYISLAESLQPKTSQHISKVSLLVLTYYIFYVYY